MQKLNAEEQVEGARVRYDLQPNCVRELLRELECKHERCHEVNKREKTLHATFRGVQGRDPRPPTSHGGRQQCSGHDHDHTGTCIFQIEEGAVPRGVCEHDGGSGGAILRLRIWKAIVRDQRCGHAQEFRRVEEKTSIYVIEQCGLFFMDQKRA